MDRVTLDTMEWRLGEEDYITFYFEDVDFGADLSSPAMTATIEIYDSGAATILAATAMTMSGTTRRKATYFLTSGAAKTITALGLYRMIGRASWSDGTNTIVREVQQQLDVRGRPGTA